MGKRIVLIGDSVFDNKAYVGNDPSVVEHLSGLVPEDEVTLLAVDGALTTDLSDQVAQIPNDATHVVVSVGGNDALDSIDVLGEPCSDVGSALALLHGRVLPFEKSYASALEPVMRRPFRLAVCSIYNGNLDEPERLPAQMALRAFNDFIIRFSAAESVPLLDLRMVCNRDEDYANPIEPSGIGGKKIAEGILRLFGLISSDYPPGELHR